MFCSNCGNKSPAGAVFCHKCGNKMGNEAVNQTPIQAPTTMDKSHPAKADVELASVYHGRGCSPQRAPLEIERPSLIKPQPILDSSDYPTSLAVEYPVTPPEPSLDEAVPPPASVINLNEYAFFPEQSAANESPEQKKALDNSGYVYFPKPDKKKPKPVVESPPVIKEAPKASYPLPPKESWKAFAENPIFADTSPKPEIHAPAEPEPVTSSPVIPVPAVTDIPSFSEYHSKPVEPVPPMEPLPTMPKLNFPDSSNFLSYPPEQSTPEPAAESWPQLKEPEPEPWPTVSDNMDFAEFLSKPIVADKPLSEKTNPVESTGFADFFSQPAIKIDTDVSDSIEAPKFEPPAPVTFNNPPSLFSDITSPDINNYQASESEPQAPLPWFADNTNFEQAKPISRDNTSYPAAPSFTTKIPEYDGNPSPDLDLIENMPKKRSSAAIIAGITMFVIAIALGAFFFINRDTASPSERIVGTWEQVIMMGTWVRHFEFNHDGTGNSYEYNTIHQLTRYETSFEWVVDGSNLYITNYTGEIDTAQFEFSAIAGRPVLRMRFDSDADWTEYW